MMKRYLLSCLVFFCTGVKAQKIDSIYINLYTDSLKKGTYNYINVDGLYSNGIYQPLDSTDLVFKSSHGKFYGNSLWIDEDFKEKKVEIKVKTKKDDSIKKEFTIYVKQQEDPPLITEEQLLSEMKNKNKKKEKDKQKEKEKN